MELPQTHPTPVSPSPTPRLLGAVTRVLSGFVRVRGSPLTPTPEGTGDHETTQSNSAQAVPWLVLHCQLAPVALLFSFLGCGTRNWGAGVCDFSSFRCLCK